MRCLRDFEGVSPHSVPSGVMITFFSVIVYFGYFSSRSEWQQASRETAFSLVLT